jgi:hypothetical protein
VKTRVVNLHREPFDVYIGRRGKGHDGYFGNPFSLAFGASDRERAECLEKFRGYFLAKVESDPEFAARVRELRGKVLGCFCKPKACHGDVIAEYVDSLEVPE